MQSHCVSQKWLLPDGSQDYRMATSKGDMSRVLSFIEALKEHYDALGMATPSKDIQARCLYMSKICKVQGWFSWDDFGKLDAISTLKLELAQNQQEGKCM